jgi:hypothetical protein
MSESEEKSYEVKDKRKFIMNEDGEVEGTNPSEPEQPAEESEAEEVMLPEVDVYSLLKSFIGMLGMQAWQKMGLLMDPSTGKIEKDMAQAKVAIDSIAALANQLEGRVSESEQRELKAMLSDLQINFVRRSSEG